MLLIDVGKLEPVWSDGDRASTLLQSERGARVVQREAEEARRDTDNAATLVALIDEASLDVRGAATSLVVGDRDQDSVRLVREATCVCIDVPRRCSRARTAVSQRREPRATATDGVRRRAVASVVRRKFAS